MSNETVKWYASWFDTPYYHQLYKNRDYTEAKRFMDNLTQHLSIQEDETILDLACGKGRHSIYLNSLGYDVTGVDLSKNSISHAKGFENDQLRFEVHDMTTPYSNDFNFVFNLFTSFGYFENEEDNLNTIKGIKSNLKENGIGVIDFLNADFIIDSLIPEETKVVDELNFHIKRFVKDGFIHKQIDFNDKGQDFSFTEKVKAISLAEFQSYFEAAGLTLLEIFGDYNLSKYQKNTSPRLILIFQ